MNWTFATFAVYSILLPFPLSPHPKAKASRGDCFDVTTSLLQLCSSVRASTFGFYVGSCENLALDGEKLRLDMGIMHPVTERERERERCALLSTDAIQMGFFPTPSYTEDTYLCTCRCSVVWFKSATDECDNSRTRESMKKTEKSLICLSAPNAPDRHIRGVLWPLRCDRRGKSLLLTSFQDWERSPVRNPVRASYAYTK